MERLDVAITSALRTFRLDVELSVGRETVARRSVERRQDDGRVAVAVHPWEISVRPGDHADGALNEIVAPVASLTPEGACGYVSGR